MFYVVKYGTRIANMDVIIFGKVAALLLFSLGTLTDMP